MVRGPLRVVLWILGSLGIVWVILLLYSLAWMGGMGGMMDGMMGGETGGMMGGQMDGTADRMPMAGGMGAMIGMMFVQTLGMLGLAGIFIYLVVDSVRRGDASASGPRSGKGA